MNFEYFNPPGRPYTDDRIELWCGNLKSAKRVHWEYLDDMLNRLIDMANAWDGQAERVVGPLRGPGVHCPAHLGPPAGWILPPRRRP